MFFTSLYFFIPPLSNGVKEGKTEELDVSEVFIIYINFLDRNSK
jgi:hypothetical protein